MCIQMNSVKNLMKNQLQLVKILFNPFHSDAAAPATKFISFLQFASGNGYRGIDDKFSYRIRLVLNDFAKNFNRIKMIK